VLLRGALFGAVLVHLVMPILAWAATPGERARQIGLWLVSATTAAIALYPRALLLPVLNSIEAFTAVAGIISFVLLVGLTVTAAHLISATLELGREVVFALRPAARFVRSVGAVALGLLPAVGLLVASERIAWVDPPLSLSASTFGAVVLLGLSVPAVRRLLDPVEPTTEQGAALARRLAFASLVFALVLCLRLADEALPSGVWAATVTVELGPGATAAERTVAEEYLRLAETRSGLRGNGERFVVRFGAGEVDAPSNSTTRFLADGRILVLLNTGLADDRRRNLLLNHFGSDLFWIRIGYVDPTIRRGFSYWIADNSRNPFVRGLASGASPVAACAALPQIDFGAPDEVFDSADASLPFVLAERERGLRGAQQLLFEILDASEEESEFIDRIEAGCDTFLATYAAPPELVIEAPAGRSDLANDAVAAAALAEAKARSGLDAYGAQFVVRYGTPPPGQRGFVESPERGRFVITLIPTMPVEERRTSLVGLFVVEFIQQHYGGDNAMLLSGYSNWAARDQSNPFVGRGSGGFTAKGACDYLPQADFVTARSVGATWLSALPFILAERRGGVAAAQELFTELLAARPIDVVAWRARVGAECQRFLSTG